MSRSLLMTALGFLMLANSPVLSQVAAPLSSSEEDVVSAVKSWCPFAPKKYCDQIKLNVHVLKISQNYASASVSRADGQGEREIAYLKRENDSWIVLDEGTGVNPVDLGIPSDW